MQAIYAPYCGTPRPPERVSRARRPLTRTYPSSVVVVVETSDEQAQEPPAGVHTQLSLPPLVQLHTPDLHAAITALLHAALDLPERPVATTSSEQAL